MRGAWCGNRGNLHGDGTEVIRLHNGKLWIVCALSYRDRRLVQWAPGRYTLLFFHDEAVAFAAGHRPCALCRRPDYRRFQDSWALAHDGRRPSAAEVDAALHTERLVGGTHRRRFHAMSWHDLPAGAFVDDGDGPALVLDDAVVPWTLDGYGTRRRRPASGRATVITPQSTVGVLRTGYPVQIDPSAIGR
jgi:hypothetical protein